MNASHHILTKFRELIALKNINVYVLPRTDEHQSQYLCPCDERLAYVSGFTGSNGIALISKEEALVWTDGRYFLQAEKELLPGWSMKKMLVQEKKWFEHIAENYPKGTKISIDGRLISAENANLRKKYLEEKQFHVQFASSNLVDQIWENRPKTGETQIFLHEEWAGKSISEKINWVRQKIVEKKGQASVFNDLSEIAWILNLRSAEIPYNPFFKSILVVKNEGGELYLPKNHESLNSAIVKQHLQKEKIELKQYEPEFPPNSLCQKSKLNYYIYSSLENPIEWQGIDLYRAARADKEVQGFIRCHIVDGVAMAKFWAWRSKQDEIGQYEAAEYLNNLRLKQKDNKGLSFVTISGGGANAAVIHYHPTKEVSSKITKQMIHLVDSGGQYYDGTTDVTRTFHFGEPKPAEKANFTRVLLGNLDVERIKWPAHVKLTGADIDVLARRHLWNVGLDYMHGTGHGVGYFEGVHEGPVGISKYNKTVFEKNMIVTNEPGYYESGQYGIRIENMLVVRQNQDGLKSFENMTICPYDKNLIDLELLTKSDVDFINAYHKRVWETLSPLLEDDQQSTQWLQKATSPI